MHRGDYYNNNDLFGVSAWYDRLIVRLSARKTNTGGKTQEQTREPPRAAPDRIVHNFYFFFFLYEGRVTKKIIRKHYSAENMLNMYLSSVRVKSI